jgi:ubiquinone biosynthesis protein
LPEEAVRQMVRDELGCEIDEHFTDFEATPLATASIAQVHSARLREDGTSVVIKVQRPALREQIEADLEIMGFLARALEANFPEARMFSPSGMVAEFEKAILKEIDFHNELDNLERFGRNFAEAEGVHFPMPYPALSGARVLTMERIVGIKISRITDETHDVDAIVERAIDAVLQMVYVDGFFHGDLHPGNVLVRDDGTICFIDFGLCGRLTPRQRDLLTDLLIAVVQQDYEGVARQFWNMTIHGRDSTPDYRTFESDVVAHAEDWFAGKTISQIEFSKVLGDLITLALRHRVRMPPDYTMTFKAIITMEGVGKQLRPDLDLLTAAQPYVGRLIAQRYQPRRILETGYAAVRDLADVLGTVPETTRAVLEDLRAGRTVVNVDSTQLDDWRRTWQHVQHRNTVGLLAGVAALCGTLALDYGGYSILGLPILSTWFYLLAAGLGAWYVVVGRRP